MESCFLKQEIVDKYSSKDNIVYIGQQNYNHMQNHHFDDYNLFSNKLFEIITKPDYVGWNTDQKSVELIKEITIKKKIYYVLVAVRPTKKNRTLFARTRYCRSRNKFDRRLHSNRYKNIVDN